MAEISQIPFTAGAGTEVSASTLSVSNPVNATAPTQTIYTSGSGTVPTGVKWLRVRMAGGGGGSGGGTQTAPGGPGGHYDFRAILFNRKWR